jgi:hypothetical protein
MPVEINRAALFGCWLHFSLRDFHTDSARPSVRYALAHSHCKPGHDPCRRVKITYDPPHDLLQHANHEAVERNMTCAGAARLQQSRPVGPCQPACTRYRRAVISCLVLRAHPVAAATIPLVFVAEVLHRRGVDSVYYLLELAMSSSSDRSVGCRSGRSGEQFREKRLVRIAPRAFAIGLDPFRMLHPQIVVNLLLKLGVRVDLVIHGRCPGKIQVWRVTVPTNGLAESLTMVCVVSARYGQVRVLQRAACVCLRCARRWANWITL